MRAQRMEERLDRLSAGLGLPSAHDWASLDAYWPLLERIRGEGAVVVLKLDGQRSGEDGEPPYTVVLSGGGLGDDFVRLDAPSLQEALGEAVLRYAQAVWPPLAGESA